MSWNKVSAFAILILLVVGLLVNYLVFYGYHNLQDRLASGEVLGRSYPLSTPDIYANEGGTIIVNGVSLVAQQNTFTDNVYMRVDITSRANPIQVDGLWQVSDLYETRVRFMSNDSEVTQYDAKKNYTLSFPYDSKYLTTDQGYIFSDSEVSLARGETPTGPWEVLTNAVHNGSNDTVSVITNKGGYYMVVAGTYISTEDVDSVETAVVEKDETQEDDSRTVILAENEIVVTVTPTPVVEDVDIDTSFDEDTNGEAIGGSAQEPRNILEALMLIFGL